MTARDNRLDQLSNGLAAKERAVPQLDHLQLFALAQQHDATTVLPQDGGAPAAGRLRLDGIPRLTRWGRTADCRGR